MIEVHKNLEAVDHSQTGFGIFFPSSILTDAAAKMGTTVALCEEDYTVWAVEDHIAWSI